MKRNSFIVMVVWLAIGNVFAQQETKEQKQQRIETQEYLSDANSELFEDNFVDAEVNYRKAISTSPSLETGKYNLGNAYYNKAKNEEAMRRFAQAAEAAQNKPEKHKAFHNLGNTFMNAKKYQEAVEAYKSALRNNPTDDETRYNLALAKEMLEKNPPQGGDGDNDDKDQQDNQDQQNQNQDKDDEGKEKEGDDGEQKEDDSDQGDEKDQNEGDKEGENKKPEQQDSKEQKDGQGEQPKQQQQQPVPGKLSPQQIKSLLQAMNDQEKKVQDKINAKKLKGAKVKSNKDW